jgi:hypothetical protein
MIDINDDRVHIWFGMLTKIAKRDRGVVIRNPSGPEEFLVPFTALALVELDLDEGTLDPDRDDSRWGRDDEEKRFAKLVGMQVVLSSSTKHFPRDAGDLVGISFLDTLDLTIGRETRKAPLSAALIIYHDFEQEKYGISGKEFAYAASNWYAGLGRRAFIVHANSNAVGLYDKLADAVRDAGGEGVIDTILIATHGSAGQLWLGNPHAIQHEDVVGRGPGFIEAQTFGRVLLDLFGPNLAIAIFSCDFVGDENGQQIVTELRNSSQARAVYAAEGTVYFSKPQLNERPTVTCTKSYVVYSGSSIVPYADGQIPVFDI